jgi:hypothetical protein
MGVRDKAGEMWPRDAGVHAGSRLPHCGDRRRPAAVPAATLPLARAFDGLSMIM